MVRINAAFTVMTIFFIRAPGRLVHKHIEDKPIFGQVKVLQIVVQERTRDQTIRDEVVFDALVLEALVQLSDVVQVAESKRRKLVGLSCLVKCNNQRPVKPVVAEQLKLVGVVVPGQSLFFRLHIENVQE